MEIFIFVAAMLGTFAGNVIYHRLNQPVQPVKKPRKPRAKKPVLDAAQAA